MSLVFNMVGGGSGGGGATAEKVMTQGQVSTTSSYATATFDNPISDYTFVEVHLFRGGVDVGWDVAKVPEAGGTTTFYITGGVYQYTMRLTTTTISCTSYSGSYVNIYVDVYAYVSIAS